MCHVGWNLSMSDNQKQPRREKQPYATYTSLFESSLSELLLNIRPVCLCRGENSAELPK